MTNCKSLCIYFTIFYILSVSIKNAISMDSGDDNESVGGTSSSASDLAILNNFLQKINSGELNVIKATPLPDVLESTSKHIDSPKVELMPDSGLWLYPNFYRHIMYYINKEGEVFYVIYKLLEYIFGEEKLLKLTTVRKLPPFEKIPIDIISTMAEFCNKYARRKRTLTEFEASINRVLECYQEEEECRRQLQADPLPITKSSLKTSSKKEVLIDPNAVDGIVQNSYGNPRIILEQLLIHIFGEDNLWKLSIKEEPHPFETIPRNTMITMIDFTDEHARSKKKYFEYVDMVKDILNKYRTKNE
ncbi:uncharacterized protein LOC122503482 [Leptopilina heterotoma]|uniref:uncharacterized protein LOC122503482 n=1 Tax=Leptopilina heterotoma TaxID=63436 RepID=UPI001CA7D991|nr:uncharacterized protein LOC122503482 [Leptopilina heterotoma]XP_043469982.1 uncharacterized protein LOC122503482 [Leptopilina heterotoma]